MMLKNKTAIILIWIISLIISFSIGLLTYWMITVKDNIPNDSINIYDGWNEFYDDKIGLYFRYPSDFEYLKLRKVMKPDNYGASSIGNNDREIEIYVNPTGDAFNEAILLQEVVNVNGEEINVVWAKYLDEDKYIARITFGEYLTNDFNDFIQISLTTYDQADWELYKKIVQSIKIDDFYKDWKTYSNTDKSFSFRYPADYLIDSDILDNSLIVLDNTSSEMELYIWIDDDNIISKVDQSNLKNVSKFKYKDKEIQRANIYCSVTITPDDVYCSPEVAGDEQILEGYYYAESFQLENEYYLLGNFSNARDNFKVEIKTQNEYYSYSESFRYFELIIKSIEFI